MNTAAATTTTTTRPLLDEDYQRLLIFRKELREFLRWSKQTAHNAGLTTSLHQLLLVVRGHSTMPGPTIGQAAEALHVRHHSAVELAQRSVRLAARDAASGVVRPCPCGQQREQMSRGV